MKRFLALVVPLVVSRVHGVAAISNWKQGGPR